MASTHVLGIDDGPFDKYRDDNTLVVGVVMAGANLVEGVLTTRLPIDGEAATERLAAWINTSRFSPTLRAILLDGITIAGLAVIDLPLLNTSTGLPVIAATRHRPAPGQLEEALRKAGYTDRLDTVERAGPFYSHGEISFECAGLEPPEARALLAQQEGRSAMPECLRLAHLIAAGVIRGESKGRI